MADTGGFDFTEVQKHQFRDFHDAWCHIARDYDTKAPFLLQISGRVEQEFSEAERLVDFITKVGDENRTTDYRIGQCVRLYNRLNKLETEIARHTCAELDKIYNLPNRDQGLAQPRLAVHREGDMCDIIKKMPGSSLEEVTGYAQTLHNKLLVDGPKSEMRMHALEAMAAAKEVYDVVGRFKKEFKGLFPEGEKRKAFESGINASLMRG